MMRKVEIQSIPETSSMEIVAISGKCTIQFRGLLTHTAGCLSQGYL